MFTLGTPLQNNLSELWSLLNFLLPDIFDDLDSFQSWFDFSEIGEKEASHKIMEQEESNHIVSKLHQILRPFLLRRVKTDVELELPSKHEKIVMTKLTELQQTYYKAIVSKTLPEILSAHAFQQMKNKGLNFFFCV
jgi:ATP-dependent DNA helicase